MWIQLYSYKLPAAAAITGHSPAGGCLLSLCCDYRVMQGPKFTIGLNETLLGIVAPFWFKVVINEWNRNLAQYNIWSRHILRKL